MTEVQKYLFDLNGDLVIENALSSGQVTRCNKALDHHSDHIAAMNRSLSAGHVDSSP